MAYKSVKNINQNQRDLLELNHRALIRKVIHSVAKIMLASVISVVSIYLLAFLFGLAAAQDTSGVAMIIGVIFIILVGLGYIIYFTVTVAGVIDEIKVVEIIEDQTLEG